ncbi:nucleotide exchange factor GrpE [Lapidilactobacillus bayanensis]|uniref:nucleotide exchange factor GrpE n=1 Tax=Lapidilactobacillus bayanensis TaxID=2485998 RepID=UPI000F79D14A|nr:nucleotide exchange factor GrpE [Lapidilactobacillus bayanensis]
MAKEIDKDFPSEKDPKFAEKEAQAKETSKAAQSDPDATKKVVDRQDTADLDELLKGDPAKQIADLKQQVADLTQKSSELDDKFLRSQAEIQNMHTRHQRERENLQKYAAQKLATAILPVVDNLQRALAANADNEQAQQIHKGVEMTLEHFQTALTDNDIKPLGEVGEVFDPTKHQAVQTSVADEDHPADTISQVLQKGYQLKDRVIRPAMVVVAK